MINDVIAFRRELEKANEFWINGKFKELEGKRLLEKDVLNEIMKEMESRRIIIITGARRVGKTIVMKQCIQKLCENVAYENILYYQLDDPSIFPLSDNALKDMIDYFLENIAKEERKYVFLDEVHLYEGWYKWLKSYYERNNEIKFIVSGSSSLALQKEANKYLRGRTAEFEIWPLNFREFLELSNIRTELILDMENIEKIFDLDSVEILREEKKVMNSFKQYLLAGGFPEWFEIKNESWFKKLVNDVPKKAIYEDIAEIFSIRSPKILEQILTFMLANQSRLLSYEAINEIARLDRETLVNYIEFLKASYLVIEILKFSRNVKEQLKSMKKYLCIDQGLRNALMKEYSLKEENIGFVIENIVGLHLFRIAKERGENIFYFKKNNEVDFIYSSHLGETIPIEVKYREKPETKEIINYVKKFKPKSFLVITKDILKKERINGSAVLFIPAWLFLLAQ